MYIIIQPTINTMEPVDLVSEKYIGYASHVINMLVVAAILVYHRCRWETDRLVRRRKRERKEEEKEVGGAKRGRRRRRRTDRQSFYMRHGRKPPFSRF